MSATCIFIVIYVISIVGVLFIGYSFLSEEDNTEENRGMVIKSAILPVYNTLIIVLTILAIFYGIIKVLINKC